MCPSIMLVRDNYPLNVFSFPKLECFAEVIYEYSATEINWRKWSSRLTR